jgi:hypothetical protein
VLNLNFKGDYMALKFPQQRKHAQRIEKYIHDSHVMLTFLMAIAIDGLR